MKLQIASGARVTREPVQVAGIEKDYDNKVGPRWLRLSQTIHVSVEVGVITPSERYRCSICETDMPGPEGEALEFLITNAESERLVFPRPEKCEDERDRYPCVGWATSGENNEVICPDCVSELQEHAQQMRKRSLTKEEAVNACPKCAQTGTCEHTR